MLTLLEGCTKLILLLFSLTKVVILRMSPKEKLFRVLLCILDRGVGGRLGL
jgi:hypothetical protein